MSNNLNQNNVAVTGDLLTIWSKANAEWRNLPITALKDYMQSNAAMPAVQVALSGGGTAQDYAGFATRAAFVTWAIGKTPAVGSVIDAAGYAYRRTGTGTVISDLPGWIPQGDVYPDHFAQNVTPGTTDMTTAIQAAIDYQYSLDGGVVYLRQVRYLINASIFLWQRVVIDGGAGGFVNQYISNAAAPAGASIFAAAGTNADLIVIRCRIEVITGQLWEVGLGRRNADIRHFGGLKNLTVWGNRSTNVSPSAVNLNNIGNGIHIQGARYIKIDNCSSMYCAENGFRAASFDYGLGALPSNNLQIEGLHCLSNAQKGFESYSADHQYVRCTAGANGSDGMNFTGSGVISSCTTWNNGRNGLLFGDMSMQAAAVIVGHYSYDNDEVGVKIGSGRAPLLSGVMSSGNGRGGVAGTTFNYQISSGAVGWSLAGCQSDAIDQDNIATTTVGFRIDNSVYPGSIDGASDVGSTIAGFSITNPDNIISHGGISGMIAHPGFKSSGSIDFNGNQASDIRGLSFNIWQTLTSITSGIVAAGASSMVTLNVSGGATVTDIISTSLFLPLIVIRNTNATSVTITHSTTKLRCNGQTSITLRQHESASFVFVSGTVWQQVGGVFSPSLITSPVDAADNRIENVRSISRNSWTNIASLTAGAVVCGTSDTIVLNIAGGTITDLTTSLLGIPRITLRNANATAVTIQHNTAKLRCMSGASVTLGQHQAVDFEFVSGVIWQQVSGVTALPVNGVANSNLAQVPTATFKGRSTAGTGNVEDLTIAQSLALLGLDAPIYGVLAADYTLTSTTAVQRLFNWSTNGAVTLATGRYRFEAILQIVAMDPTSGNAGFDLLGGGTATVAEVLMQSAGVDTNSPNATVSSLSGVLASTTATVANMVNAVTQTGLGVRIAGMFNVTTAGTVIPSIALVTAAAAIVRSKSYINFTRVGPTGAVTVGAWT